MAPGSLDQLRRLEEKWPVLRARAERFRLAWLVIIGAYAGWLISIVLVWSQEFIRTALWALVILESPVCYHLVSVFLPRTRALYRLPFEEYVHRLESLRGMPKPRIRMRVLSAVASVGGIATTAWSLVLFAFGPHSVEFLLETVFLVLGVAVLLMTASSLLTLPVWVEVDKVLTAGSIANRLKSVALGYAAAASVFLGVSAISRLGFIL